MAAGACSTGKSIEGPNYVIFDAGQSKALLAQCSRHAPAPGEGGWLPSPGDIARLEGELPTALRTSPNKAGPDLAGAPQGWWRQYVGIVRNGRRSIYGNFFRASYYSGGDKWRTSPFVVCDGGPTFFGVEYDAEKGKIIDIEFNGEA